MLKHEMMKNLFNRSGLLGSVFPLLVLVPAACSEGRTNMEKENTDLPQSTVPLVTAVNAKTQFAEINGRKIAYRSVGNGEPVILCQRFRGNLDNWDPAFLDELAKNYKVITFDYTGFGLSTGTPSNDMLGFANDVKDLAKVLNLSKFAIGGWSFGGAVAQIVTTEMPELVSHTILIGTRPPGNFKHPPEQVFLDASRKPVNDFEDEVVLFFEPASELSRLKAKQSHYRIAERAVDKDVIVGPELWKHYFAGFEDYGKDPYNARKKLMETTIPILVISASHEVVFPPENWFELNRKLPTVQVVVIPQTGHGPHHQYPEMVGTYIHSFIVNHKRS